MQTETPRRRWIASEDAQQLWREYRDTQDPRLRDRLIMTYAPLVKYIAYRKVRELPASCQVEDFISCGLEALINAIDRYDPEKGATLEQFAWTRIHGAILDELRRQDWAPRSVRRWERDIEAARRNFAGVHGRPPTREELADSLGTTVVELREREQKIATSDLTSLNAIVPGEEDSGVERVDTLASDDLRADPEHVTSMGDAKDRFRRAFGRLPQRQREIAVLLYVKELTLREIGDVLGVSESRVCQIHTELKRSLRSTLSEDESLFREVA
ncbi:MAG: polymerase sigma factor FliA [Solirubrobacteraceae bacterium]|jgi:RNA polymerase sigma factor for flagellar operon FliA|nr:polymerase sigma factor FliA [Solirubrobacteraceae bacterium]